VAVTQIQLALLNAYANGHFDKDGNPDASSPRLLPDFANLTKEVANPYYPAYDKDCRFRAFVLGKKATDQSGIYIQDSFSDLVIVLRVLETGDPSTGQSIGFLADVAEYGLCYLNSTIESLRDLYRGVPLYLAGNLLAGGVVQAYMAICQYSQIGDDPDLTAVTYTPLGGGHVASAFGVPDEFMPGVKRLTNYIVKN
jgi:hypothetical protein